MKYGLKINIYNKILEEILMNGIVLTGIGIGMVALAVILFIISIVYRNTAGKKIQEELGKEYE